MDYKDARAILEYHNLWRKGKDVEMLSPAKITEAIDVAVKLLKAFEEPVSKCEPQTNTFIEQCDHREVGTDGGGDYCKICGKRMNY